MPKAMAWSWSCPEVMMRRWFVLVLVGCSQEPDWYEGCTLDCAANEICVASSPDGERCVSDVPECEELFQSKDSCVLTPEECVQAVCGQSSTYGTECWLDRDDKIWNYINCGIPF
jgi:hypothetical protein